MKARASNIDGSTGRKSPRWAFMERLDIPCQDGLVYLTRLRIIQTPWFGLYLHDINAPDSDPHPHDHPWTFVSIVLRGHYVEEFHPYPNVSPQFYVRTNTWRRGSIHRMGRESAHRIIEAAPGLKTLILVGRRKRDWGFFTDAGWVQWEDYFSQQPKRDHRGGRA